MTANEEIIQLRKELEETRTERDAFKKSLLHMLPVDGTEYSLEEALALVGKYPSLEEIVSGLKNEIATGRT